MKTVSIWLPRERECKGSVLFKLTKEREKELIAAGTPPSITNVYINRCVPEVAHAKQVCVTLVFEDGKSPASTEDAALLASLKEAS